MLRRLSFVAALSLLPLLASCGGGPLSSSQPATPQRTPVVDPGLSDAAPPREMPEHPGGAYGFTHFVFQQMGDQVLTTLVEGPRGPQVRLPYSLPALQEVLSSGSPIPAELQMSRDDLETLVEQLETLRAATDKYREVGAALADGYVKVTDEVPNMGTHYQHQGRVDDGVFNLEEPEGLIYILDDNGEWQLQGTFLLLPREAVGDAHPDTFAGPLDNWHMHYGLCLPDVALLDGCEMSGGIPVQSSPWMVHAWVRDDNPLGVFHMWNPNIAPYAEEDTLRSDSSRAVALPQPGSITATINNFEHTTIEIMAGQTITWLNVDGVPHTVTSGSNGAEDGGFDSGLLNEGRAFAQRFDQAGVFPYTCTVHPQMNGTIIVEAAGS